MLLNWIETSYNIMALHSSGYETFQLLDKSMVKKEESLNAEIVSRTL
jgi:hypothetical protein